MTEKTTGPEIYNPALVEKIRNLTGIRFLNLILPNLITLGFVIASLTAFFVLIIGGIRWITAGGDKTAVESARGMITSALIGLVLVFCLYAILIFLEKFFGIDLITIDIGPLMLK